MVGSTETGSAIDSNEQTMNNEYRDLSKKIIIKN